MINNWLLRLFQSDSFDSLTALRYLHKTDSVGIQYYIARRLRKFPIQEIEFLLPQLIHMAVTRPGTLALEAFILYQCMVSPHTAILTIWYIESYLRDYQLNPPSPSHLFLRSFHSKLQEIIFSDNPKPPKRTNFISFISSRFQTSKIQQNLAPALVGIGSALASIANPALLSESRDVVIMEGQNPVDFSDEEVENSSSTEDWIDESENRSVRSSYDSASHSRQLTGDELNSRLPHGPTLEDLSRGSAFSFSKYSEKAVLTLAKSNVPESSHYAFSEMEFIMALVNIGDRLRSMPKEARQSSLIAELSLLNHNLPADVCVPMWCNATEEAPYHHKVLRISPNDCVILNSADRVPYLICIEILEHDHWIDGSASEEDLSTLSRPSPKIVKQDRKGSNVKVEAENAEIGLGAFSVSDDAQKTTPADQSSCTIKNDTLQSTEEQSELKQAAEDLIHSAPFVENISPFELESGSLKKSSETDHLVKLNNISPMKSLEGGTNEPASSDTFVPKLLKKPTINRRTSSLLESPISSPETEYNRSTRRVSTITKLNEFAERMRTAAVMMAQLYQQQQRELAALNTVPDRQTIPRSTIPHSLSAESLPPQRRVNGRLSVTSPPSSPVSTSPRTVTIKTDRRKYLKMKSNFEEIRQRLVKEMLSLEEQRVKLQQSLSDDEVKVNEIRKGELKSVPDDPSAAVFRESWDAKIHRIKQASRFSNEKGWKLVSVIVKSGADLRQEQLCIQLIREFQTIWRNAQVPVWVHCFKILVTSGQSGLIETIRNAVSIHSIKKNMIPRSDEDQCSLYDYFVLEYGHPEGAEFRAAQDNFMRSLVGYSIITYILQIKDRHNGNILLDASGHLIHIDFGFILSNSPGSMGFELAPFKLPQEYIDVLGGTSSPKFAEFRKLMKEAFLAVRKKMENILILVEMMEFESALPCFTGASTKPSTVYVPPTASSFIPSFSSQPQLANSTEGHPHEMLNEKIIPNKTPATKYPVTVALRERFHGNLNDQQMCDLVDRLVDSSGRNTFTRLYDSFQYYANGIM